MNKEQNVLIVGGGGREDALTWKLRQSPWVGNIWVAPGNGGTERFADTKRVHLNPNEPVEVIDAVKDLKSGLVVVGPEVPLIKGLADRLRAENLLVFGPGAEAAQLEGSKTYAINFMEKYGIPHPKSFIFDSYYKVVSFLVDNPAREALSLMNRGLVVKADGPAAGKGVFVFDQGETEGAYEALDRIMRQKEFGNAGGGVVIQEKLKGFELSAMVLVSGGRYVILPYSEDHKQVYDGDKGPNTGGMGVAAPHPLVTPQLAQEIKETIIKRTILGLKQEGIDFRGVLYPGIMVTSSGPKVLEYNIRFGDPETEAVLPIMAGDLFLSLKDTASGTLNPATIQYPVKDGFTVVITLAAHGYPFSYQKGTEIFGLACPTNETEVVVYHAGTELDKDGRYYTSGGRVLMVTGFGPTIEGARNRAYGVIGPEGIHFDGMQYRRDVGSRRRI